jgi:hypothetical protein
MMQPVRGSVIWLVLMLALVVSTCFLNGMHVEAFTSNHMAWQGQCHRQGQRLTRTSIRIKAPSIKGLVYRRSELQASPLLSAITTGFKTLHSNPSYITMAVLWLSSFGISLERRTVLGKALSAPLATMALALTVANIGLIPFQSSVYSFVNKYLVALAVPLLLFDSDLRRVITDTGTLLAAFAVGAFATVVGTLVAFPIVPLTGLGTDVGWRVACALAARHIGGAINFVAVAETLNIGGNAVAAASK